MAKTRKSNLARVRVTPKYQDHRISLDRFSLSQALAQSEGLLR
jgi:hypothetical protein